MGIGGLRDFDEERPDESIAPASLPAGLLWPKGLEMHPGGMWPVLPRDFSWPALFQFLQREVYMKKVAKGKFTGYDRRDGNLYEFEVHPPGFPIPYRVTMSGTFVEIENFACIVSSGRFHWSKTSPPSVVIDDLPASQVLAMIVQALIEL